MGFNIKSFAKDVLRMAGSMAGIGSGFGKGLVSVQLEPTDVEITALDIITQSGDVVQSLLGIVKEINLYESILSPAIFCDLSIYDANDIKSRTDLASYTNTLIKVGFRSPQADKPNEYVLQVADQIDTKTVPNIKGEVYTLRCISPELFKSNQITFSNAGQAVENYPHEMIDIILKIWLETDKKIHIKKKSDISINEVFAPIEPLRAIDDLRRLCVTHDYISSCFVFYEDCEGYHLNTIENMIQEEKTIFGSRASDRIFFFDGRKNQDHAGSNYRTILAYNEISHGDILDDATKMQVNYFNAVAGGEPARTTDSNNENTNLHYMDERGKNIRSVESLASAREARKAALLVATAGTGPNGENIPDMLSDRVLVNRAHFLANLLRNMKHIYVYGDNRLRVGNLISVDFAIPTDVNDEKSKLVRYSGQYMVGKIRHMIINDDRPKYLMSMEIFKSGVQED